MARVKLGHFCERWAALNAALQARNEPVATISEADEFIERYQGTPAPWIAFVLIGARSTKQS